MIERDCVYCSLNMRSGGCVNCNYTGAQPPTRAEVKEMLSLAREVVQKDEETAEAERLVWCQLWSTHDSGVPVSDQFCSLHTTDEKRQEFHRRYISMMPDEAPDSFVAWSVDSRWNRLPAYRCRVDEKTYKRISDSDIGLWCVTIPADTIEAIGLIPPNDLTSLTEGMMTAH